MAIETIETVEISCSVDESPAVSWAAVVAGAVPLTRNYIFEQKRKRVGGVTNAGLATPGGPLEGE